MGSYSEGDTPYAQDVENPAATVSLAGYSIKGLVSAEGVTKYLGIPYAEIPARFRQARLIDSASLQGVHDGQRYGPRCPQPPDKPREWRAHLYDGIQHSDSLPQSEFDCLNLNVYAPAQIFGQLLPVWVWLHGGAWLFGDGGPEYTGEYFVQHSVRMGEPCIYVGINYRLGYYGFLTSKELQDEAAADGETPFSNIGLVDQRLALQWIQKNIHYFGGDASNITLAGESAGAWSVLAHLRSSIPVCRRAVLMSGPSFAPRDLAAAQGEFDRLVACAGVDARASDSQKLACLRALSTEELGSYVRSFSIFPSDDREWFCYRDQRSSTRPQPLEMDGRFPTWLDDVIIGSTKHEFAIFGIVNGWNKWPIETLINAVRSTLSNDATLAEQVLHVYKLEGIKDRKSVFENLVRFCSDALFGGLLHQTGTDSEPPFTSASASRFIYRFDQIDTTESSPFHNYAYHALDNVFTCRLPAVAGDAAPPEYRTTADFLSSSLVNFVNGLHPWPAWDASSSANRTEIMAFNGADSGLVEWSGLSEEWEAVTEKDGEKEAVLRAAAAALLSWSPPS